MTKEMNKNRPDALGDRMKSYEALATNSTLMPNLPVYVRIDGRAFHTLCRGLEKPFDSTFVTVMQTVCKELVEETNAILGYVQSDEISLAWEDPSKAPFDGRIFKLTSVLAALATSSFIRNTYVFPGAKLAEKVRTNNVSFDCRVFQVPSMIELANCFIWRENDAVRNSIQMLGQANFSHKELQGVSCKELQSKLLDKGINWSEDLPAELKRGTYFKRYLIWKQLDQDVLEKIPEDQRPENGLVMRSEVRNFELPIMKRVANKVEAYFYGEEAREYEDLN